MLTPPSPPPPLTEEDVETYEKRFAGFIEKGITSETIEEMYASALTNIRANPNPTKPISTFKPNKAFAHPKKISLEQRKERVAAKKAAQATKLSAALEAAGDDEE